MVPAPEQPARRSLTAPPRPSPIASRSAVVGLQTTQAKQRIVGQFETRIQPADGLFLGLSWFRYGLREIEESDVQLICGDEIIQVHLEFTLVQPLYV